MCQLNFKSDFLLKIYLSNIENKHVWMCIILGSCLSDTVSISNLSTNGSDLYNFMVQNNKLIELKKFEMIPSVDPEIENVSTRINELCDI